MTETEMTEMLNVTASSIFLPSPTLLPSSTILPSPILPSPSNGNSICIECGAQLSDGHFHYHAITNTTNEIMIPTITSWPPMQSQATNPYGTETYGEKTKPLVRFSASQTCPKCLCIDMTTYFCDHPILGTCTEKSTKRYINAEHIHQTCVKCKWTDVYAPADMVLDEDNEEAI